MATEMTEEVDNLRSEEQALVDALWWAVSHLDAESFVAAVIEGLQGTPTRTIADGDPRVPLIVALSALVRSDDAER